MLPESTTVMPLLTGVMHRIASSEGRRTTSELAILCHKDGYKCRLNNVKCYMMPSSEVRKTTTESGHDSFFMN